MTAPFPTAEDTARASLTDEHRALLADPEVAGRFEDLLAACVAETPSWGSQTGPFWHVDTVGFTPDGGAMAKHAAFEVGLERQQRDAAKIDALIVVELQVDGLRAVTSLDALCVDHGVEWGERRDIRATLAAGEPYQRDAMGGWSKLPKRAVVRAAALLARAA